MSGIAGKEITNELLFRSTIQSLPPNVDDSGGIEMWQWTKMGQITWKISSTDKSDKSSSQEELLERIVSLYSL